MSEFKSDFSIKLKPGKDDVWELTAFLEYESDIAGTIFVPKGFNTDLASVPRVPIAYMFWGGQAHREAVIHDYLYRIDAEPSVSFEVANEVFLEAMKSRGKPWYVRYPMYWGVCLGGHSCYWRMKVKDEI
jgi:hypothetical protein